MTISPRRRWVRPVAVLLTALAGCPAADDGAVKPGPAARMAVTPENGVAAADRLISLINAVRAEYGLRTLRKSTMLTQLAEDHACRMIEAGFFSHVDPESGMGPLQRALQNGYLVLSIGENLAGGQTLPEDVLEDWMASIQGHRENILSVQWDEIGVAVMAGGEHGVYWVAEFANLP